MDKNEPTTVEKMDATLLRNILIIEGEEAFQTEIRRRLLELCGEEPDDEQDQSIE